MPSVLDSHNEVRDANDWLPPPRQRPLSLEFSTSPSGKVSVSIRHDDGRSVFACTSSYTTLLEMEPNRWREFVAALVSKLDTLTPEQADAAGAT